MDDVVGFLARIFTDRPYILISWPGTAMFLGTLLALASQTTAKALAIVPRTAEGLIGIVTAPFIHANFAHLVANLPPFVVLGGVILRRGDAEFLHVSLTIALAQGVLLWLCGRRAAHMGMSGVIFGFFGWLVGIAWFTRQTDDLLIAGGVLILYGGILAGVAPARNNSSWEGHLFGLIAGIGAVWFRYNL
ncbi:MAG: rhomboid family intramembrane serine protease [Nibricoccus sp.]